MLRLFLAEKTYKMFNYRFVNSGKIIVMGNTEAKKLYLKLLGRGVIPCPIDNFTRFNLDSKLVCLAVALTLHKAKIDYRRLKKLDIGIIGTNKEGAFFSNLAYYKDYILGGQVLGRANLFIYTLPSSPLAESAINFRLTGPLLYMYPEGSGKNGIIEFSKNLIKLKQAEGMLVVNWSKNRADCILII